MTKKNTIPLTERQLKLIETFGVLGNKNGLQPAAARIFALLIVSDKIELTFDEIRHTLGFSKGATSNAINSLLVQKKILYTTKTGDRKRYFRSNIETWKDSIKVGFSFLTSFHIFLENVLEVRTKDTTGFNGSIKDLSDFLLFVKEELSEIYEKWEQKKNSAK